MSDDAHDIELTRSFWTTLYTRDWARIREFFDDESVYWDVPVGPQAAARGAGDIEARLRLGFEPLDKIEERPGAVVVAGDGIVMTEHVEVWHFPTGEVIPLPFVSVQHVRGDTITLWKDYWNYGTLVDDAPGWWHERLANADLSWMYDASHLA